MGQKSGTNTTGKEAGEAKDAPVDGKPGNATSGNGTSSDKSGNSDGKGEGEGEGEEDDEFHDTHDTVVTANDAPRRRAPRKKPGVASALETADDDKYDDAWLPEYNDGPANEKVVDGEWVAVKKPKPTR